MDVSEIVVYAYSDNYIYDIKPIVIKGVINITVENLQVDFENPEEKAKFLTEKEVSVILSLMIYS